MLHISVRKDFDVDAQELAVAKGLMRHSFDQALIGDSSAGMNVDANELSAGGKSNRDCTFRIIPQYVNPERQIKGAPDSKCNGSHECHGMGRYLPGIKGYVTKVLQDQPVHAAGCERLSVF